MKNLVRPAFWLASLLLVSFLAACSTPASRIKEDPAAFAKLTPAQQELVRKGQIELGMDRSAVELALGKPDRTRTRTTAEGSSEVWLYLAHEGDTAGSLYYGRGFYTPYGGRWWGPGVGAGAIYYAADSESYPALKVEFRADRVTGFEQESR